MAEAPAQPVSPGSAQPPAADSSAPAAIRLRRLRKQFPARRPLPPVVAVNDIDLDVRDGEFLTLLGPSGSGKTTVLRLIAGFEQPTSGRVELAGVDVTDRPPFARDVNTVFQDYALFPHMTVGQNVEYGLRVRKVARAERQRRMHEALAAVSLDGYDARRPDELSGGQRQRVALARALVNRPRVLLLDEPLGALDLKLRERMQVELKGIQRQVGITFVFVTHDQQEALTMSDRIAVFNGGRIEQVGPPDVVYEHPQTEFVAGFVGTSNLLRGDAARAVLGRDGIWSVRPEKIRLLREHETAPIGWRCAPGTVREVVYVGDLTRFVIEVADGAQLVAVQQNLETSSADIAAYRGRRVQLSWRPEHEFEVAASATPPERTGARGDEDADGESAGHRARPELYGGTPGIPPAGGE
jgi:putative spermidine/putrescine transport system ATP-binding protein